MPGGFKPEYKPPPESANQAVKIWNFTRQIDWQGFEVLFEMYGVVDPELVLRQLKTIRDFTQRGR